MEKAPNLEIPEIYLGDWLDLFEVGPVEAARKAGCSQPHLSNMIAGRKPNVNVLFLLRLSEYLGVTVNDFYRPLPSKSQLEALKALSPKARAALLQRERRGT